MTTRSIVTTVLIALMLASAAGAQDPPNIWRAYADRLPAGALVAIHLSDGTTIQGQVIRYDEDTLTVLPKTRLPVPVRRLAFADMQSIEVRKEGMSPGAKVLTGVGSAAGVVVILTIALLAGMR